MWITHYERNDLGEPPECFHFESEVFAATWLVYQCLTFCYLMSAFPEKRVSLYYAQNGIVSLKTRRGRSQKLQRNRRLP